MICKCSKDLGCFLPGDEISFGIEAFCSGDYTFEVWARGLMVREVVAFEAGDELKLPNTFTEDGETTIKIKIPEDCATIPGFNYITTPDGACQFKFKSIVSTCG
jgi:hypothetical protein